MPTLATRDALTTEALDTDLIEVTRVGDKTYKQDRSIFMKKLRTLDGFTVTVDDDVYPRALIEYIDQSSDWVYTAGAQDITGFGGRKQVSISARNTVTNEFLGILVSNEMLEIKHVNALGASTATITVKDGSIQMKGLPTNPLGLAVNSIWNDSGTLKIVT